MPSLQVTIVGTGYLGATHAVCMASLGFDVLAFDVDRSKIERLAQGVLPFFEPGLEEMLQEELESGRLRFTDSVAEVAQFGDVHFLCVQTPQLDGSLAADVSFLDAALDMLLPLLERPCVVVGKSTVPVGTAERLAARVVAETPAGSDVELTWNPEFLREGFAVEDTLRPDRLVFGVSSSAGEDLMRRVFRPVIETGTPVVVTDLATAQLVKVAANAFLATKISFINAMAEVCEVTGADVTHLAKALSHDSRIGGRFLHAGLGFGGGCLPKDIRGFMARAEELGVNQALTFLSEVDAINLRRRARMVDLARELSQGSFDNKRVAVLGAAFKPNSDDIRDSPALDVASRIQQEGGLVVVFDPVAMDNARGAYPDLTFAGHTEAAVDGAHLVLLLTEWAEFVRIDPHKLKLIVADSNIVDGRNALDPALWREAGWNYRALGRP